MVLTMSIAMVSGRRRPAPAYKRRAFDVERVHVAYQQSAFLIECSQFFGGARTARGKMRSISARVLRRFMPTSMTMAPAGCIGCDHGRPPDCRH